MIGDTFSIAVPGYRGSVSTFSLEGLRDSVINGTGYKKYAREHIDQIERGLFFCLDSGRSYYFFDHKDVGRTKPYELAVYSVTLKYSVNRLADSFWEFVIKYCLGDKYSTLFPNSTPDAVFSPATV
jgi:hypothetical protein